MKAFSNLSLKNLTPIVRGAGTKIRKSLWVLGQDAFLFIILFVLLDIAYGEFLLYKHRYMEQAHVIEFTSAPVTFKEQVYQSVIKEWQTREEHPNYSIWENYPDPFL